MHLLAVFPGHGVTHKGRESNFYSIADNLLCVALTETFLL